MKRAACLATLCCALSLGSSTPVVADHLRQQVNRASAGWPLADFALVDQHGAPFTQEDLQGRWTLLLLEDSLCAAPCEAALSALADLFQRVDSIQAINTLQAVLVLPDSPDDPPEGLDQYLARYGPRFIGVRGSHHALQGLADDLGVTPRDAAGSIWVIGPDGILRAELMPPFDVRLLTAEFMKTRSCR